MNSGVESRRGPYCCGVWEALWPLINSSIKTVCLFVRLGLPTLLLDPSLKSSCLSLLSSWDSRRDTTHCWVGAETVQRPPSSVGLGVSVSSFNRCRHQLFYFLLPILAVCDSPAELRHLGGTQASRKQALVRWSCLTRVTWVCGFGWAVCGSQLLLNSFVPAVLLACHKIPYIPFFFFLTSCRILDYYLSGSSWSSLWVTFPLITICLEWCQDGLCNRFKPRGLGNSGLWVNVTVVKYRSKTVRWWTWKGTKVWWCPKRAAGRWVTNLDLLISYFNLVFVWVGFNRIVNLKAT